MNDVVTEEDVLKVEKQEEVQKKYLLIPIANILENNWNPNKMDTLEYNGLRESLNDCGGNAHWPITVRTHPDELGMYQIIDGAHRFRAMSELGFEEIICTLEECATPEAMKKTIKYNKHRWQPDAAKMSGLIHTLVVDFKVPYEELEADLGYTVDELKTMESEMDFDFDKYKDEEEDLLKEVKEEKINVNETFSIHLSPDQTKELKKLLKKTWIKDKSMAVLVCAKYVIGQMFDGNCSDETLDEIKVWADSLSWDTIILDDEMDIVTPDEI